MMPHRKVPLGNTSFLARERLKAPAGVNWLNKKLRARKGSEMTR